MWSCVCTCVRVRMCAFVCAFVFVCVNFVHFCVHACAGSTCAEPRCVHIGAGLGTRTIVCTCGCACVHIYAACVCARLCSGVQGRVSAPVPVGVCGFVSAHGCACPREPESVPLYSCLDDLGGSSPTLMVLCCIPGMFLCAHVCVCRCWGACVRVRVQPGGCVRARCLSRAAGADNCGCYYEPANPPNPFTSCSQGITN